MTKNSISETFPEQTLFEAAFKYASIGTALLRPDGSWLIVNDALCQILGYTRDELHNFTFRDITYPEDHAVDEYYVEQLVSGRARHCHFEKRYFHKNGGIVWALLSVVYVSDETGGPAFFITQIKDITARKTAAEEISRILEHSPDIIFRMNPEGRIIFINGTVERMLRIPRSEYLGKTFAEVAERGRPAKRFIAQVAEAIGRCEPVSFEYEGLLRSDTFYTCTVTPEYQGDVRLNSFLMFLRDITPVRRAQLALEKSERELNSVLTGTPTVIAKLTRDFRHVYINDAVERETAIPAEMFIGKTLGEVGIPNPVVRRIEAAIAEVFKTGESIEFEFAYDSPHGLKYYLGRFTPELTAAGEVEAVLVFALDITERKLAELELKEALEQVKQLQKMLPICTYCKNIRDDQDYWHTVESYVARHAGAEFSHSICPSCYETRVLPELRKYKEKNRKSPIDE
ncbi:MAG: PAS domain S-box protein [Acidobacteria bacterium]|nr:PAS domain S-box protein [Acidobacteriota bacterium]